MILRMVANSRIVSLDQLKQVIVKVHGGKYRWTWKKFKVAVQNMGCKFFFLLDTGFSPKWQCRLGTIDKDAKETIKVQGKPSGLWFTRKKDSAESVKADESVSIQRPPLNRSNSMWLLRKPLVEEPEEEPVEEPVNEPVKELVNEPVNEPPVAAPPRVTRQRSKTTSSSFWPGRMSTKDESKELVCAPPKRRSAKSPSPSRSHNSEGGEGENFNTLFAESSWWWLNIISGNDGDGTSTCLALERVRCARLHHERTPKNHEHNQCHFDHSRVNPCYPCHCSWCWWRSIGVGCSPGGWSHCRWLGPSAEQHYRKEHPKAWGTFLEYDSLNSQQMLDICPLDYVFAG